jgi:putative two-component system response regulator
VSALYPAPEPPREQVLVVDDEPAITSLVARTLESYGYDTAVAHTRLEAHSAAAAHPFDLVLCDVNLDRDSGLQLIGELLAEHPSTAGLMVTGMDDPALARAALERGAYGYVIKPFTTNELLINVANALRRRSLELANRRYQELLERRVEERTATLRGALDQVKSSEAALRRSQEETIRRLGGAIELRDLDTGRHVGRMSELCGRIGARLGLGPQRIALIRTASRLHDVGKLGVEDAILRKPAALTAEERLAMQQHAELGRDILAGSPSELLELAAVIAWTHHERWDGTGYPRGLTGEEIPLEGRIAAAADVYDALTSDRPYRPALPQAAALELMASERGRHFDPTVLDALVAVLA